MPPTNDSIEGMHACAKKYKKALPEYFATYQRIVQRACIPRVYPQLESVLNVKKAFVVLSI